MTPRRAVTRARALLNCSLLFAVAAAALGCAGHCEWTPAAPPSAGGVQVRIVSVEGACAPREREKIASAIALVGAVLNDPVFQNDIRRGPQLSASQQSVLNGDQANTQIVPPGATYVWNMHAPGDARKPIINEDVLRYLVRGNVSGHPGSVEIAVVRNARWWALWCGWPWYNEEGHREAPNTIVTQDCAFDRWSASDMVGHWVHEYMHMIGFDHAFKSDPLRPFSIPYFVGDRAVAAAVRLGGPPSVDARGGPED